MLCCTGFLKVSGLVFCTYTNYLFCCPPSTLFDLLIMHSTVKSPAEARYFRPSTKVRHCLIWRVRIVSDFVLLNGNTRRSTF